eukprot:TRINITY_DN14987_c0_g4_i1.p1 TRINITY_DN14987_c0_g4~~TRINITY_DN14987_c0_g4_i1.p1  ORF type:complete len:650 (+),score=72.04 TRINITY_DN14987_c0_g4_i1:68-1951(+)
MSRRSTLLKLHGPVDRAPTRALSVCGGNPAVRDATYELVPSPEPAVGSVLPAQASEPAACKVLLAQAPPEVVPAQAKKSKRCIALLAQAPEPATVEATVRRATDHKHRDIFASSCVNVRLRAKTPPKIAVAQHRHEKAHSTPASEELEESEGAHKKRRKAAKASGGATEESKCARHKQEGVKKSCEDLRKVEQRKRAQNSGKGSRAKRKKVAAFRNNGVPDEVVEPDCTTQKQAKLVKSREASTEGCKRARQRHAKKVDSSGAAEAVEDCKHAQQFQGKALAHRGASKRAGECTRAERKNETTVAEETKESPEKRNKQDTGLESVGAPKEAQTCKSAGRNTEKASTSDGVPEGADDAERFFVVQAPLHLGLKLRVGVTYSEVELLHRCRGCAEKIATLQALMQDPSKLLPCLSSDVPLEGPPEGCRQRHLDIDGGASLSAGSALPSPRTSAEENVLGSSGRLRRVAASNAARPTSVAAPTGSPDAETSRPKACDGVDGRREENLAMQSSVPSRRNVAVGPYGFAADQVVWYCGVRRSPWPARIIGPSVYPGTFWIKLLSHTEQERQHSDEEYTPNSVRSCLANVAQLLPFVTGDADAVARVAKVAESAHAQQACLGERQLRKRLKLQ